MIMNALVQGAWHWQNNLCIQAGGGLGEGVLGEDDDAEAAELVRLEGRRAEDEGRVVGEGLVLLLVHRVALGGGVVAEGGEVEVREAVEVEVAEVN